MYKNHDLENDLLELAEGITECMVGTWWDTDKGCGCPMSQLAIYKGIATAVEIEDEYVKGIEVQAYLEDRFLRYYDGQGYLIRKFPVRFDRLFDETIEKETFSPDTDYVTDHDLIKKVMIAAIKSSKESQV